MSRLAERLSWRAAGELELSVYEDPGSMARTFAYLFGLGGLLLLATLVLPHDPDRSVPGLVAMALVALLTATGFLIGFDRLPRWVFMLAPALGSTVIGGVMYFGGSEAVGAYAMYFFWVALSAAYFFGLEVAFANIAYGTAVFAIVLTERSNVTLAELHWVMLAGALSVAGALTVRLRDHAERASRDTERHKAEFFELVSHELRTPLTSIVGYLDLLRDTGRELSPEQERQFLDVMSRNSQRLLRLVGDLLFVARFDATGEVELAQRPFDIRDVVRESIEAFAPRAEREGFELISEFEGTGACVGDPERIGQALDNLISNAMKFTPSGGEIVLRVLDGHPDRVVVEVADTGIGIPEAEQVKIFDRFYRASEAKRLSIDGTGLGLAITRTIVAGHGGEIGLASAPGAGTTVTISLPAAEGAEEPKAPHADEASPVVP